MQKLHEASKNSRKNKVDYLNIDEDEQNEKLNIAPEKVYWLIEKMKQFSSECSLKYVKRP
jgi:hypothetical protein